MSSIIDSLYPIFSQFSCLVSGGHYRQPQEVLEELIALASDPGWQKGLGVRLEPGQDYSYARSSLEDLIKREYLVKREGDLLDEYNESCKRNNNRNL